MGPVQTLHLMSDRRRARGRPTLARIAAELGVSVMTVSNAYNRPDQLSHELRERILEKARELGYAGPDPLARGLRHGRAGALGVLYDTWPSYVFEDPSAVAFLQGLSGATGRAFIGLPQGPHRRRLGLGGCSRLRMPLPPSRPRGCPSTARSAASTNGATRHQRHPRSSCCTSGARTGPSGAWGALHRRVRRFA
jgi:hypothetical protein